jgi:hypothetical protein
MPRKSAAAIAVLDPRGHRLEPPPDLSAAERVVFIAAVRSVKPGHFAAEDTPILSAYCAAIVQERTIARELETEGDDKAKDKLRNAHGRVVGSLTRLATALRLGAMARSPSRNRRSAVTVEPLAGVAPAPWEYRHGEPN